MMWTNRIVIAATVVAIIYLVCIALSLLFGRGPL